LTSDNFISAFPGRLRIQHADPSGLITRDIWKEGTGPIPIPGELYQHGYSTYRLDGEKVTQRYHLIDPNTVRLIVTLEDPLFLTRPFKYAYIFDKKPGGPNPAIRECDADVARREVIFGYPGNKYDEDDYQ
jgi:hypothetical protein